MSGRSSSAPINVVRTHSRFRRIAKWTGTVACVATLAAGVLTLKLRFEWLSAEERIGIAAQWGALWLIWRSDGYPFDAWGGPVPEAGWSIHWYEFDWSEAFGLASRQITRPTLGWASPKHRSLSIPFWMLLVAIGIPTFRLWQRDRRYKPGHCRHCGYNLTGNQCGVCPECGEPAHETRRANAESPPAVEGVQAAE
jgi:hypothetical protein